MAIANDGYIVPDGDLAYYNGILYTILAKQGQLNTYTNQATEIGTIITTLTSEIASGQNLLALIRDLPESSS